MQTLQILLPSNDLLLYLVTRILVGYDTLLQIRHVLKLMILDRMKLVGLLLLVCV